MCVEVDIASLQFNNHINRKEFLIGTVLYKTKSLDGTKRNTNPKSKN